MTAATCPEDGRLGNVCFLAENSSGLTRNMQGDMLTIALWNWLQDAFCLQGANI